MAYDAQKKNLKENYTRVPLNVKNEIYEEYKRKCYAGGTTPIGELNKFILKYIGKL